MLKRTIRRINLPEMSAPAAFRRLCVETHTPYRWVQRSSPAAFRRLCVETHNEEEALVKAEPAAFRRLCVETIRLKQRGRLKTDQPPLGGCVLKLSSSILLDTSTSQPPLGGCVLKQRLLKKHLQSLAQPPLGGCVLKRQATLFISVQIASRL